MKTLIQMLDGLSELTGRVISWATFFLLLATLSVVVLRYMFNVGATSLQDSAVYLHGAVFTFAAGYALKHDEHVRVDVFYQKFSPRTRHLVDFWGTLLFLFPVSAFIGWESWEYVKSSWDIREASPEAGGLPYVYLQKTLLLVLVASLVIQGLVELYRNGTQIFSARNP